ncbi:hypothetical protein [Clostridium sp. C2-6-12]|uniref:hypothetical protein n=1 Tax=Clostridium sp. C2-6-12 TaxID=2698832 RepID=UPI00136E8545|nr:hypothetical protein [Clostridium sp. C2-6-12]
MKKKSIIGILSAALLVSFLQIGCSNIAAAASTPNKIQETANQTNQSIGYTKTIRKILQYEKNMTDYNSVSLPFVVGDINVNFTDTQNLKVNAEAIINGNDENYENSLLTELSLNAKEECGEIELDPYRGEHMLYEKAADYNRNKCNVKINYTIQIPKSVKNINLSSTDGTINCDNIQCEKLNIKHVGPGNITLGINSLKEGSNLNVKSYTGDVNLKVNENAKCTINSKKLETNETETKTFNGGGSTINVELAGGKLVL